MTDARKFPVGDNSQAENKENDWLKKHPNPPHNTKSWKRGVGPNQEEGAHKCYGKLPELPEEAGFVDPEPKEWAKMLP